MVRKALTTDEFIEKSRQIHGDKYDYSKVDYTKIKERVIIICKKHGEFSQTPSLHFKGSGCRVCWGSCGRSTEDFIKKSRKIHGNKYDYTKTKYINAHTHVIIICKKHGEFSQTPAHHKRGHGCSTCGMKTGRPVLTFEEFVKKSRKVHGDKYHYRKEWFGGTKYKCKNGDVDISMKCPKHGKFTLSNPYQHYKKSGICPTCRTELNRPFLFEKFVSKSQAIHGNFYDYTRVNYVNAHTLITITCPEHGPFPQLPLSHTNQGSGCPLCVTGGYVSAISRIWLETLDIADLEYEKTLFLTNGDKIRVDGYSSSSNTIYEFLGTWWHGHPDFFNSQDIHPRVNKTYGELYHCTIQRLTKTEDSGFNLEIMWEHDWAKISGKRNAPAARGVK